MADEPPAGRDAHLDEALTATDPSSVAENPDATRRLDSAEQDLVVVSERLSGAEQRLAGAAEKLAATREGILSAAKDAFREGLGPPVRSVPVVPAEAGTDLLLDPDPVNRRRALESASTVPGPAGDRLVVRALQDPDDSVRAVAVRAAARRGSSLAEEVLRAALDRRWPSAQRVALESISSLFESPTSPAPVPMSESLLHRFLGGVAALDPPPLGAEREALGTVARAAGTEVLSEHLARTDAARHGAARLLEAEGSRPSLAVLAAHDDDPSEEIRRAATRATALLVEAAGTAGVASAGVSVAEGAAAEPFGSLNDELIEAMGVALGDPEETVREHARDVLGSTDRGAIGGWIGRRLAGGSAEQAALAARVLESVPIAGSAGLLLERACSADDVGRGPFLRALAALELSPDGLASALATVDPAHRAPAVHLVWQVGGSALLPHLEPLIQDPSGPVRTAVLEVFAESLDPSAPELALRVLREDASAMVRATAVHVLSRGPAETRLAALSQGLADPDPDVRATAVEALPHGIGTSAADSLLRALEDPDERVWKASIRHLSSLRDRGAPFLWRGIKESPPLKRDELVRSIESSDPDLLADLALIHSALEDRAGRALAVELAARAGTPACRARVLAALEDPDPLVRRAAAVSVSSIRSSATIPVLARALSDPQVDVRVEVIRTVALIDDNDVLGLLVSALKDPEIRVRDAASQGLARWRSPAVARTLAEALATPDLRRAAGDLLERMGAAAIGPLVDIVAGDDLELAAVSGALLERIAGPQPFVAALSSVHPEDRLRAVEVLGRMGDPTASEALLTTLSDPDERVRGRAVTLLGEVGDPRAVEPLKRAFRTDPVVEVAEAARESLRKLEAGSIPEPSDAADPRDAGAAEH
jgi:HEAT repeat protein